MKNDKIKDVPLTKEMVGVRINTIQNTQSGYYANLLLHQEPRASMKVMDELYPGWQRTHQEIGGQMFCTISVFDKELGTWISRQDVGSAGEFEKDKSKATDSFKRAVVNFVPALRALYYAPQIRIKLNDNEVSQGNTGNYRCYTKFVATELAFDFEKQEFTSLVITDDKGNVRFDIKSQNNVTLPAPKATASIKTANSTATNNGLTCIECGKKVTPKVAEFSQRKFNKCLCMDCQKVAQAA